MPHFVPRRILSLETLETRITPTGLGTTPPEPPAGLPSHEALPLLGISLALPSAGRPGLGLDVGPLSLGVGGGSGGLLSLGIGGGSGGGLLSLGMGDGTGSQSPGSQGFLSPPSSQGAGGIGGGVLTPSNLPLVTTNAPPVAPQAVVPPPSSTPPSLPPTPVPGASVVASLSPFVPFRPATPVEVAPAAGVPNNTNAVPEPAIVTVETISSTLPRSASVNDLVFESFSSPRKPEAVAPPPRGEVADDRLADELFRLREGKLLEDFGAAFAGNDAFAVALRNIVPEQGESDSAMALWLVGLVAGCVAGAAWLNRREEQEADPLDAEPFANPAG